MGGCSFYVYNIAHFSFDYNSFFGVRMSGIIPTITHFLVFNLISYALFKTGWVCIFQQDKVIPFHSFIYGTIDK